MQLIDEDKICSVVYGLSVFLQGFVVSMHKGICEQEFLLAPGLDVLLAHAWVHHDNKTQQISFNHNYSMTFFILPHAFKRQITWSKQEPLVVWLPCLCQMMTLTMTIVTSQRLSSRDIMELMLWILTSMGHHISLNWYQVLAWRVWCHVLTFVTNKIIWCRALVT